MSFTKLATASTLVALALLMEKPACADPLYNLTSLSTSQLLYISTTFTPPGTALNDLGQVVGYMPPGPNWQQGYGFVYNGAPGGNGSVTPLGGSTDPVNYPPIRNTQPLTINNSGQIVGNTQPAPGTNPGGYYLYSNGQVTPLQYPSDAPNQGGYVLGSTTAPNGSQSPVIENVLSHTQQAIGQAPGATSTLGMVINNAGQVAGNTLIAGSSNPASPAQGGGFFYSNGTITNIGTLGGAWTSVWAMNDSGQVVGGSALSATGIAHAFLYSNGKMTDLGTLPGDQNSSAQWINAQGQIVGGSGTGNNSSGFLYSSGVMMNLNSLISPNTGWTILDGVSINKLGQILAIGYNPSLVPIDGSGQGYVLLTPSDLPAPGDPVYPTITPEPSSLAIYGLMALGLVLRLRRRRRRPAAQATAEDHRNVGSPR